MPRSPSTLGGSTPWYDDPITHGYSTTYQGPGTDTPHYAYDLGTPFHTELTAPLAGTVKVADFQPWGGEVYVQPDDKNYPQYYMFHLDDETVHAGQHVNAGDELGLSGGQNSGGDHPAQSQYSTGPHTHVGWFTKYTTTPDHGTIPYGPDPANLMAAAHGSGLIGPTNVFPISQTVYNEVEPIAIQDNVPDWLWETVAMAESGGNPQATHMEANGHMSVGLFQLEQGVGQGGSHSVQELQDPKLNAQIGMLSIASAYNAEQPFADTTSWWQTFAGASGHPGGAPGNPTTDNEAASLKTIYETYASGDTSGGSNSGGSDPLTAISTFFANLPSEIGPLLVRTGVGLVGVVLIGAGTFDIVGGLKGESGMDVAKGAVDKAKTAAITVAAPEAAAVVNARKDKSKSGQIKREARKQKAEKRKPAPKEAA